MGEYCIFATFGIMFEIVKMIKIIYKKRYLNSLFIFMFKLSFHLYLYNHLHQLFILSKCIKVIQFRYGHYYYIYFNSFELNFLILFLFIFN